MARWEVWIFSSRMSVLLRKRITEVLLNQGSSRIVLNSARLSFMRFCGGQRQVVAPKDAFTSWVMKTWGISDPLSDREELDLSTLCAQHPELSKILPEWTSDGTTRV